MKRTGRITFDDVTFQKLIDGETLRFDIKPDTATIEFSLDPRSKHRDRLVQIFREAVDKPAPALFSLPGRG